MSTITKEFTKEQLIAKAREQIAFCRDTKITGEGRAHVNQCSALFEIALASLEAEPVSFNELRDAVAEVSGGPAMEWSDIYKGHQAVPFINFNSLARIVEKFRTAPSAPVSVPDAYIRDDRGRMILNGESEPRIGYGAGWNACRAAMLRD
ncbi:hypothetical protein [Enterobacter ludwigii]|uniref:hypothetical protein n=1 Tax=Enterobacter ludwigii TaxID=299767 RepID=UPI00397539EC